MTRLRAQLFVSDRPERENHGDGFVHCLKRIENNCRPAKAAVRSCAQIPPCRTCGSSLRFSYQSGSSAAGSSSEGEQCAFALAKAANANSSCLLRRRFSLPAKGPLYAFRRANGMLLTSSVTSSHSTVVIRRENVPHEPTSIRETHKLAPSSLLGCNIFTN